LGPRFFQCGDQKPPLLVIERNTVKLLLGRRAERRCGGCHVAAAHVLRQIGDINCFADG
jgi:hypothetical protein